MYKKAGIIIGTLLIVVAIVVFLIANAVQNENKEEKPKDTATQSTSMAVQTVGTDVNTPATVANTQATINAAQAPATSPIATQATTYYVAETTSFDIGEFTTAETTAAAPEVSPTSLIEVREETLPETITRADAGTVVGHKVYAYNGQVLYSLLINTTTCGQVEYFTTYNNYKLPEGTRLECQMLIYMAQSGSFPSIASISVAS